MFSRPLKKFRVIDLTNVLSGPFCGYLLANMGAQVIKVEVPESGDLARQLGASPELNKNKMGASFLAQNAGKKSLTINLKTAAGKKLFEKLIRTADVLIENFRPGVMTRLGLGFDDLKLINPKLIYCAISGFGATGPLRYLPAYDQIIQGLSGVMSITGDSSSAPLRVGYPIADTIGGMSAAFAIAATLAGRNGETDEAVFIDVSMLDSTMSTMGWVVSNYLIAGKDPIPMGNDNFTASPSGTFQTGDGPLNIAANKQEQFEKLCELLGLPELTTDPHFSQRQLRLQNRQELKQLLEQALKSKSAEAWEEELSSAGVPAGRVLSVPEALNHPHMRDRGMIGHFDNVPRVGNVDVFRPGFKLNGLSPQVDTPPPLLGQHTDEMLTDLGLTAEDIAALRQEKVV
ncbi:Crotonobetainyl-CoA:carnitine CoA-transferase CaiB [Desulfuromusa kysingii]|uniref:Crotonobetainyl-CoA:carnitine CoA-transferase CaiB n=1 Tax=Desulfuromusa kysingii TaxID=37625 RepID=A0A1H4AXL0_9BACT|nr:CoA transferase [Desulfuromusa kysingii]SEA40372.1 Crotonobetainyl-CoA:carnitine CoA-transferase CaiB [Desulfuromusa kysingii]